MSATGSGPVEDDPLEYWNEVENDRPPSNDSLAAYPVGAKHVPHRKNAAEWLIWIFWFPATRFSRWFNAWSDIRKLTLGVGLGFLIGGNRHGVSLGHSFFIAGVIVVAAAIRWERPRNL